MKPHRNKTELTHNITQAASLWLDGKGFKPVETEVGVCQGWLADIAGVGCPTQTELIDMKLLKRPPAWRYGRDEATQQAARDDWLTSRAAIPGIITTLIEVKTSVGDFRGDRKWLIDWPVNLCFLAMPHGMIAPDKWPKGWGILLFSQDGSTLLKSMPGEVRQVTIEQQRDVILNLAVARDHRTRHARIREFSQNMRIQDGERKTISRISDAIRFVAAVVSGEAPFEAARLRYGIQAKIPTYILDELEELRKKTASAQILGREQQEE